MKIELRRIDEIRPYDKNPRINDDAVDAVAASIREFGFRQAIVVDADGVIICGHTRWKAAQKLGLEKVPVHVAKDLSPEQIKAYRIADNKTAELAEWNYELLPIELGELQACNFDLGLLGFDQDELAKLLDTGVQEGLTDPDAIPEPPDEAITQPGDLWILGEHRLLCGDSSKAEDVDRLLAGAVIQLVNTDPPYNVKVEPRSNNAIAFHPELEAGFSTIDIGGILSNVANKFLLEGFFSVERTWRNICTTRNVSDFKTVTSYRLIGKDQYEQVAPGGELKHGTLGNETYSNKADTYGLMLSIDRRDIINDDLGAITTVPRKLGRGSGLKINDVFWATFLDNATFFSADNKNLLTGADTVLTIEGLTKAEVAFMDQVDSDGKPIGIMPATGIAKEAWDYLWVEYEHAVDAVAQRTVRRPHAVHVERVYEQAAWSGLGIGS